MDLYKPQIINLLQELDAALSAPLELIICGGAAGILSGSFNRATLDIDIVYSIPSLSLCNDALLAVAKKHGLESNWLNDKAAIFADSLPDDYRSRAEPVHAKFKHLKVCTISRGDLLFMKLAGLRPEDVKDIEFMQLDSADIPALKSGLDKLRTTNANQYYLVKSVLNERGLRL